MVKVAIKTDAAPKSKHAHIKSEYAFIDDLEMVMAKGSNPAVSVPVAASDTVKGVTYLCSGLFVFSFQDIIVKLLSSTFPVYELVFIRGLIAAPLIFLYVHYDSGFRTLSVKRPWFHFIRSLAMFISYMAFYLSLAALPLTMAVALFFTAPSSSQPCPFLCWVSRWAGADGWEF